MKNSSIQHTIDLGELGDREVVVNYDYSPGRPAVMYLRNGDPGYPEDPPEIVLCSVVDTESKIDLLKLIFGDALSRIEEKIIQSEEE